MEILPSVTVNYGVRFDKFTAFTSATQWSPRVNLVWQALDDTVVHAGYSDTCRLRPSNSSAPKR